MSNIVYALTNPAMPGIVKIGMTGRDNPEVRMNELYTTGVPLPFECAIAIEVEDGRAERLERSLHMAFGPYRVNPSREFFEIETYQVEAILKTWPGSDVTPRVNEETKNLDAADREASRRFISRRPNLNFAEMGVPVGAVLISVDTGEEATVTGDRRVSFRGEETYLSDASKKASRLNRVQPTRRWIFEGRSLREIYDETYGPRGG